MRLKNLFVLFALVAAVYVAYVAASIYSFGNVDEMRKADAAIVLGAGVQKNQPNPVFAERIQHAIRLYKSGYVRKLIFTGGRGAGNTYSDSFIAREYAIRHAIPSRDILIEEQSSTTRENLQYAAQVAASNDLSTFLVVSDPLHMKRAMRIAADDGLKAWSSPTPSTRYRTVRARAAFLVREVCFYIADSVYRLLPFLHTALPGL